MRNWSSSRRWAREAFLLTLSGLVASASFAQTTGGIAGWIADSSGAPLPGVTVQASSASLQGKRAGVTEKNGSYRFPALPPGRYTLRATRPGFANVEKTVTVTVDSTSIVRMILQLSLSERVFVSAEAPLVDTTSTTTGTRYDSRVVIHLPVDHKYADGIKLSPGVVEDLGQTQGRSQQLAFEGATSAEHQWIIEGINTTNVLKGVQGKAINNEFVEEVEVKTGGYQAEYGRALGGVINVVTRSGGNTFHGDGFLYYDSQALRADRVFVNGVDSSLSGMRLADYRRTDYGIDLGGFLLRDRLWFFGAYNRVEFPADVSRYQSSETVPSTLAFPLEGTDNLYAFKLTWNVAGGSTLVATVFGDPSSNSGAGAADPTQGSFSLRPITSPDPGTWESERSIGGTDFGLRFNQVFGSSALLTLQGGRHQDRYQLAPIGAGLRVRLADFTCVDGTQSAPCLVPTEPNSVVGGFGQIGGVENNSRSHRDQFRADVNLYWNSHEFKLGADYQDSRTDAQLSLSGGQLVSVYNEYGQVYYKHQFFASSAVELTPIASQGSVASARELGIYAQDSWKVAPGLTINAGLRWDEERLRDFSDVTRIRLTDEWQPRLGVVWDPWGDGATRIYAFAGRFYHALSTEIAAREFSASLSVQTYNFDPAAVTQDPTVFGHSVPFVSGGVFAALVDVGLTGASLDEYTVGVERAFDGSWLVGLKATYRRLRGAIEDRCDLDSTGQFPLNSCGIMNPGSDGPIASGDLPGCNGLDGEFRQCLDSSPPTPAARRLYRGIGIAARRSLADRFWLQASYLYSSLRGNYDGAVSEGFGGITIPGSNPDFDYPALWHHSYGRLYLDRPHDLRLSGFYATPLGLSIGLVAWLRSGAPLDKTGYFNGVYGPRAQLVPRGYSGRLPMEWDADLTLEYPVRVGPLTVTLQGYLYNVFNNQIRTGQDTVWSNQQPIGYPDTIFDPNQQQTNTAYGNITIRQSPRLFRAAVRVSF